MTTPDDDTREPHSVELEIEVPGTPEEVWAAIASGPGITAWLHPTELEQREGGRMSYDMGAGMTGSATVREWDPPRRYVEEAVWPLSGDESNASSLATEWVVEARAGGTCVVRMVTSGFASGAGWDEELEGFTEAMETAFANLRLYLTHFPAASGAWVRVFGNAPGDLAQGFAALTRELGLADAGPGARVSSGTDAPALSGTVEHVAAGKWQRQLLLRLDEPVPGLASVGIWGEAATTTVQLCVYGDQGAAVAAREQPAWQEWMQAHFPAPDAASRPA